MRGVLHLKFDHMNHTILFTILCIVLVILAGLLIKIGFDIKHSFESAGWPAIQGTMIKMRTTLDIDNNNNDNNNNRTFDCKYTYEINGKTYTSDRIGYGNYNMTTVGKTELKRIIDSYKQGNEVTIYYDPQKNKRSVIEPGFNKSLLIYLVGFLFLFLCCLYRIIEADY